MKHRKLWICAGVFLLVLSVSLSVCLYRAMKKLDMFWHASDDLYNLLIRDYSVVDFVMDNVDDMKPTDILDDSEIFPNQVYYNYDFMLDEHGQFELLTERRTPADLAVIVSRPRPDASADVPLRVTYTIADERYGILYTIENNIVININLMGPDGAGGRTSNVHLFMRYAQPYGEAGYPPLIERYGAPDSPEVKEFEEIEALYESGAFEEIEARGLGYVHTTPGGRILIF